MLWLWLCAFVRLGATFVSGPKGIRKGTGLIVESTMAHYSESLNAHVHTHSKALVDA